MKIFDRLKLKVWRFRLEEAATVSVEMVLMTPILVWGFLSTLQFFYAYRTELISTKAALTIADMYSRETGYIDWTYVNGTRELLTYLTLSDNNPDYRVTLFYWHENKNWYNVSWSKNRGSRLNMTRDELNTQASRLPVLSDGERAILIETWAEYQPKYGNGIGYMMGTGLAPIEFATHVVISPRFAPTVCWNNTPWDATMDRC